LPADAASRLRHVAIRSARADYATRIFNDTERDIDGLVANEPFVADFDPQRVEENQRIHRFQRPVLPFGHGLQNRVGHRRNEIGRDLQAIKLQQMALDLANGHAARIH